jgi:hypothetical protein
VRLILEQTATTLRHRTVLALFPLLASTVLVAATSAQSAPRGYFRATQRENSDWVRLEFMKSKEKAGDAPIASGDVPRGELAALVAEHLTPGFAGPLQFTLKRDAGTFTFDGVATNGVVEGSFAFLGSSRFSEVLVRRGYARPTERERFSLTLTGVGYALLDEIDAQGYVHPATADLVRMGTHGVDLAYLRMMAPIGDQVRSIARLTQLRDHGVDLDYVAQLERLGYANISGETLMRLRDRGIDSTFVAEFQRAGYDRLTLEELISLKDHGVTASFAAQARASAGSGRPTASDLVRAKERGVS